MADDVTAALAAADQRAAGARDDALMVAAYWKVLRDEGLPAALRNSLTELYAGSLFAPDWPPPEDY